ncbi:hypothetical protein PS2_006531 [Malus domestica]
MQFRLVQARSFLVPFAVSACAGKERLVSFFMLVRTKSIGAVFYARADQEHVNLSSDLGKSFLTIFIAMSLD